MVYRQRRYRPRSRASFKGTRRPYMRRPYRYRRRTAIRPYIPRPLSYGCPPTQMIRLKFGITVDINPATASSSWQTFRANSCYDPDLSGAGHQPRYFDQWMSMYTYAYCLGSKLTVRKIDPTSATTAGMKVSIFLSEDPTLPAKVLASATNSFEAKQRVSATKVISGIDTVTDPSRNRVVGKYSHTKLWRKPLRSNEFRFDNSNDCTEQAYFHVGFQAIHGNDPDLATFEFDLEYIVLFTNPRVVVIS